MGDFVARLSRLLPGVWLGASAGLAALGTPAAFALVPDRALAGQVAGRMLAAEAYLSLALGLLLMMLARRASRDAVEAGVPGATQFSAEFALAAVALACTVAGYFAVLPMMQAARGGGGGLGVGALHAISVGFYGAKLLALFAMAWRATRLPP
jgi:hypothetical protein